MPLTVSPNRGFTLLLQSQQERNQERTSTATQRLATGLRINSGSDDPAGLIAAESLRAEQTDLQANLKGYRNQRNALNQAGSELSAIQSGLNNLRGMVVEGADGLLSNQQSQALQLAADATIDSFNRFSTAPDETRVLVSGAEGNLVDGDPAVAAEAIDAAASSVALEQAAVAADQRQLDRYEQLARDQEVIVTQSISETEDADFAEEASHLAIASVLTKAATLAQAYSQTAHADTIGSLLDRLEP